MVVCAAALHATWNLMSKKAADGSPTDFVFAYRLVSSFLYAPWVAWILWTEGVVRSAPVVLFMVLASLVHLGYNLALQWGYRAADLSVVYPVARGTGPQLSSLGAFVLRAEPVTLSGVLGIAAVVLGIVLIAADGDRRRVAAFAAGMRGRWRHALLVGLLPPLGYILVLYAYRFGGNVSVVAPLREMSLMMGSIAGFVLLREPASWARLVGCVVIVGGVLLLEV